MSDIFISYSHEDLLWAQDLAQVLGARSWSIFWDRTIPIGKTWRETVGRELSEARCVIVLWSKTSVESEWVREEAEDARQRRVLVPVRIDDTQLPIGFRGIQTADLVNWNPTKPTLAFDRLSADIASLIGLSIPEESKEQVRRADMDVRRKTQIIPLRPPRVSIGSSFEPFLATGPGDQYKEVLMIYVRNQSASPLYIAHAVYFRDGANRIPIYANAWVSQKYPKGFELKFGPEWRDAEMLIAAKTEVDTYIPLDTPVTALEFPAGKRGTLLLEYIQDGRPGVHRGKL